ncbi:TIGR04388 family protein, partial [Leptospira santarosai]|uniref:TIGR04388 family protein n=1 Tax=Leptospira santarosai TaxID=28183 RepID=UPI0024AF9933
MRQNKFTKIQFDIADDGVTNRSTFGGKACVFEPVQHTCKNRNIIGKLKTLQTASVQSLSKNFKNLIQKLNLSEFLQQTLDKETDSNRASIRKRQNLWELPQQTLAEKTDSNRASIPKRQNLWELPQQTLAETTDSNRASIPKRQNLWELPQQTLGETTDSNHASTRKLKLWELPQQTLGETTNSNRASTQKLKLSEFLQQTLAEETNSNRASTRKRQNLWELPRQTLGEKMGIQIQKTESKGPGMDLNTLRIMNMKFEDGKRISIQNTGPVKNRFSLRTKLVSLMMLLTFVVVFVIPLTIFEELHAQSVPTLGSSKQFASDELKPYVDAAKAGSSDTGTFLNTVTNGEQVIEAAWETGVNAEIEAILGGVTTSDSVNNVNVYKDAVRAQLELQKQQAKSRWLADVNAYVQAELQIFLAALSQNTSNNVTASNTNAVNTINPTVQSVTTTPVSQATNPAQAAQSYYQGSQLWDTKWQDLISKQNTWEQNSLSAIQTGILQWNQSIAGLENDKVTYLNSIEQTKAQWLANKQIIQNAQTQMRGALQSTITNIRNQENQLKANASSDPGLTSVFGDMDELLEDLQDALNSNASLGTLAQTLGNFFQNQISNATTKADYWNTTKWQETYATQVLDFKKEVATANLSCSHTSGGGSNWCNGQLSGSQSVIYGSDGNIYGWAATNGGFQNGVLVSSFDPVTISNPAYAELNQQYQSCQAQGGGGFGWFVWLTYPCSQFGWNGENAPVQSWTSNPNNTSGYYSEGHYVIECNGFELGGSCSGGQGYTLGGDYCGNAAFMCGYNKRWQTDDSYSTSVTETFNQSQKDQIATNTKIRNAVLGNYNIAFGQSSQAGNAVAGSSVALETKAWLGGTALNSSNWYGSLGLTNQVQIQTKYKYIDSAMQANENFWTSMKTQFTSIASTFLSLVNPLKDWEARSEEYEEEYQAKLLELEQTKQTTIQNYNDQISQMKAARGAWVTEVYGYQMAGIEGSADNANSQYRTGQENWDNTISVFQQVELNWYLSAKDTLQQAVEAPDGETQYQTNSIPQANQIQTQITNSETNTSQLYNAATGLYQTYQYSAAGNVMQQVLTNQQNQTSWNQQGAALSGSIADSFGRSETYKTAELSASNRINALAQTIYGNGAYIVDNTELSQIQTQITSNG